MSETTPQSSPTPAKRRPPYVVGAIIVIVVAAIVILMTTLRNSNEQKQAHALTTETAKGPVVQTARVIVSPPEDSVQVEGDARPYYTATLYAKLSGYLKTIHVDKGDRVRNGELLATIESPETDPQYFAAVAAMRNDSQIAVRDLALYHKALMSQQDYEQAEFNLQQAEQTAEQYKSLKSYEDIRAPFAGTITARYADPGALVQNAQNGASSSLPVVSIADLDRLRIELYLDQQYASFVHVGDQVRITLPERTAFAELARVTRFTGELDVQTRMLLVEAEADNRGNQIEAGSTVRAEVNVKHPVQLQIPVAALVVKGNRNYAGEIINGNTFHLLPIVIGENYGQTIEVDSGLIGNEILAINVGNTVADGGHVQIAQHSALPTSDTSSTGGGNGSAPAGGSPGTPNGMNASPVNGNGSKAQ